MSNLDVIAQAQASVEATNEIDELRFDALYEHLQLLASYVRSGEEAAWRRDGRTLGIHLRQARMVLITVLRTFREIGEVSA